MLAPNVLALLVVLSHLCYCFETITASFTRPTVTVANATLVGTKLPTFSQDFFGGVPYAQPPIGDLRLRLPISINSSYMNGTFDASDYGPACPGHGNGVKSVSLIDLERSSG